MREPQRLASLEVQRSGRYPGSSAQLVLLQAQVTLLRDSAGAHPQPVPAVALEVMAEVHQTSLFSHTVQCFLEKQFLVRQLR